MAPQSIPLSVFYTKEPYTQKIALTEQQLI